MGKSHTTNVVLENCLLSCAMPSSAPLVQLRAPMSALVLHYDQLETNVCEATGLAHPNAKIERILSATAAASGGSGSRGRWSAPFCAKARLFGCVNFADVFSASLQSLVMLLIRCMADAKSAAHEAMQMIRKFCARTWSNEGGGARVTFVLHSALPLLQRSALRSAAVALQVGFLGRGL